MKKTAIVYTSIAGSTGEIAGLLRDALSKQTVSCDLLKAEEADHIDRYDTIIIGSPMRFGALAKDARRFIRRFSDELKNKTLFLFETCLYIIEAEEDQTPGIPVYIDPSLNMDTKSVKKMDFMDRTHRVSHYMKKIRSDTRGLHPEAVAFFNGRLDLSKLGITARIFMRVITAFTDRERVGDFIHPAAVKEWAGIISGQ